MNTNSHEDVNSVNESASDAEPFYIATGTLHYIVELLYCCTV